MGGGGRLWKTCQKVEQDMGGGGRLWKTCQKVEQDMGGGGGGVVIKKCLKNVVFIFN